MFPMTEFGKLPVDVAWHRMPHRNMDSAFSLWHCALCGAVLLQCEEPAYSLYDMDALGTNSACFLGLMCYTIQPVEATDWLW